MKISDEAQLRPTVNELDLSLILPLQDWDLKTLSQLQNFTSFWANAPMLIELVFASSDSAPDEIPFKSTLPKNIQIRTVKASTKNSRGSATISGLQAARGRWLACSSVDCSWPLGEILRVYLRAVDNEEKSQRNEEDPVSLFIANRRGQKKRQGEKTGLRKLFEDIEHEKSRSLNLQDPTSPYFMIRSESFRKMLSSETESKKVLRPRRWFFSPRIYQTARKLNLKIEEIDVATVNQPQTSFRLIDIL